MLFWTHRAAPRDELMPLSWNAIVHFYFPFVVDLFFFFAAPYSAGIFERARYLTMCFVQGYKSR